MTVSDYVVELDNAYEKLKDLSWSNSHLTFDEMLHMAVELRKAELSSNKNEAGFDLEELRAIIRADAIDEFVKFIYAKNATREEQYVLDIAEEFKALK